MRQATTLRAPAATAAAPTDRASGRVEAIDILRGFALCGILLIHAAVFASPGAPPGIGHVGGALDTLLLGGLIALVEAKFFSLFAALFGLGFALQWRSARGDDGRFVPRFQRRLFFLGLIGALHVALLWEGDILLLYALAGLLLIPFRASSTRTLLRWAVALLAAPLAVYLLALAGLALAQVDPGSAATIRAGEAQFSAGFAAARADVVARYAGDSFGQAVVGRVLDYLGKAPLLLTRLPAVLAMFLLGFAVGRRGILGDVEAHLPLLRRARAWGLGLGLPASLLVTLGYWTLPPFASLTALGVNQVLAGPVLAVGYAATLALLLRRAAWRRAFAPLARYGRLGLSAYLLQSTALGLLFYGYGLGLVGQVAPLAALLLAVGLNGALIALSGWWLRRFRTGPAEWAWRSLTVGAAQPLRRTPPTPLPPRGVPLPPLNLGQGER